VFRIMGDLPAAFFGLGQRRSGDGRVDDAYGTTLRLAH
jgi:hypothetical protein